MKHSFHIIFSKQYIVMGNCIFRMESYPCIDSDLDIVKNLWNSVDDTHKYELMLTCYIESLKRHPENKRFFSLSITDQVDKIIRYVDDIFSSDITKFNNILSRYPLICISVSSLDKLINVLINTLRKNYFLNAEMDISVRNVILYIIYPTYNNQVPENVGKKYPPEILDFQKFLNNKICMSYFEIYMTICHAQENVEFWKIMTAFLSTRKIKLLRIMRDEFLADNACKSVNISCVDRRELLSAIAEYINNRHDKAIFRRLKKNIIKNIGTTEYIMYTNKWHSFLESALCNEMIKIL